MLSRVLATGTFLVLVCCQTGPGFEPDLGNSLIDHLSWELVPEEEDPFWGRVEKPVVCTDESYGAEGLAAASFYEVETSNCNYHTVTQPSLVDIKVGDSIKATLWHLPLVALEAAKAKLFVSIAGRIALEEDIAIPSTEEVYFSETIADFDAPAGSPVIFHVHNHGLNSWRFHRLTVEH